MPVETAHQPKPFVPRDGRVRAQCGHCRRDFAPDKGGAQRSKDGGPKTPKRWTKLGDGKFLCDVCRAAQFVVRVIRCEVGDVAEAESRDKQEFIAAAYQASQELAKFGNWFLQRLYAADPATDPKTWTKNSKGQDALPALPEVPFYEATRIFTGVSPRVLCQAAQNVRGHYAQDRFNVFVSLLRSTRSYKKTTLPLPIPNQAWQFIVLPDGQIGASIAVGPGKNWKLRLRIDAANREYARQIMEGVAIQRGAAMLVLRRREVYAGENKGSFVKRWTLKVVACFPRKKARQSHREVTLELGHDAKCLWVGRILDDQEGELWEFPAVRLKERLVSHLHRDQRRQIDNSRLSRRARRRLGQNRTRHCDHNNFFVQKETEQQIAALVRRCVSAGVTTVQYEITDRGWAKHFPWYRLRQKLAIALENEGLALHVLDGGEAVSACAKPTAEMGDEA